MKSPLIVFLVLAVCSLSAFAQAANDQKEAEEVAQIRKLLAGLNFQSGQITIGKNLATLSLPTGYRYLNPSDTATVLTKLWSNPPQEHPSLGMIVPPGSDLVSQGSWAVLITYEEDGHIKDHDAQSIDYNKLLKQMQSSSAEANAERRKRGYPTVEIVGWAASPRYDATGKKLYWAKELQFEGDPSHTLNYDIRLLGRTGVLSLNAIAGTSDLSMIEKATPALLAAVSFNPGNRYADFNHSTDKVASYGLAALVAGGVAAKAGLFKGLWLGILAFKKFIIVGLIAVFAFVKKIIKGRSA